MEVYATDFGILSKWNYIIYECDLLFEDEIMLFLVVLQ